VAGQRSDDPLDRLAENVKRVRKERGLRQQDVANLGELALSDVGRIERGRRDPGIRVLSRIAYGLDIPPADLLRGVSWAPKKDPP
jgi:XRE family transcriptional regulator, regulator of sulfur utilization